MRKPASPAPAVMKREVVCLKLRVPLRWVKPICVTAVLVGVFALAAGSWITGLCLLLGSYLFEKNFYRCPHCGKQMDMKAPMFKGAVCPFCKQSLRP